MSGEQIPEKLIRQARQGDEAALGELFQHFRPYLSLLARLKLDHPAQGKVDDSDLVQETVMSAYRSFAQFRGETEPQFAAWLRQILANTSVNQRQHYRRQRRDVRLEKRLGQDLNQSSCALGGSFMANDTSPSEKAIRRERAVQLAQMLSRLPGDYREVLILRDLEGRKLTEVAERMGRSFDSVQKLWTRAVIKLRQMIEDEL